MIDLAPLLPAATPRRVLCIGAHADDIEIGCGATLAALQGGRTGDLRIDWVVLSCGGARREEAERARERLLLPDCRGRFVAGDLPDGRFPAAYAALKDRFEALKEAEPPDVILCHERDDRHQDHRAVNELAWSTFRDHLILEYEVPKWDGGLGQPNVYVPVDAQSVRAKIDTLMACYASQRSRHWFTEDTFLSLMRLRGVECRSPTGYAEAFHGRKLRLHGI